MSNACTPVVACQAQDSIKHARLLCFHLRGGKVCVWGGLAEPPLAIYPGGRSVPPGDIRKVKRDLTLVSLLPHPSLFESMLGAMLRGAGWGSYSSRAPCFLHDLRDPRPSALPTPAAPTPRRAPLLALAPLPGPITLLGTAGTRGRMLQRAPWCLRCSIPPEPQGYPKWHLLSQACPVTPCKMHGDFHPPIVSPFLPVVDRRMTPSDVRVLNPDQ